MTSQTEGNNLQQQIYELKQELKLMAIYEALYKEWEKCDRDSADTSRHFITMWMKAALQKRALIETLERISEWESVQESVPLDILMIIDEVLDKIE